VSLKGRCFFGLLDVLLVPPLVEDVLEPGLLPVGPVAVLDEHPDDRGCHRDALVGGEQDAFILGEVLVPLIPPSWSRK